MMHATTMAIAGSIHHRPWRANSRPASPPTVMKTSARVCAASATSSSLPSSAPRRCSYQAITTLTPSVSTSTASCMSLTLTRRVPLARSLTAPRTSSKQVTDRKPTMARALPNTARDPDATPTASLAPTTTRLAARRPNSTRRTRADAGGGEQPHRAEVDLLVARERAWDALLGLRERGWVEHDSVEPLVPALELAQQVEGVGLAPRDVRESVERGVLASPRQRIGARIHGDHLARAARQVQREGPVVGEEVEGTAGAALLGHEHAVLALVEERARLLAGVGRGEVADSVLLDGERVGHAAERRDHFERQRFMAPDRRVVAEQDALGCERPADARYDVFAGLLEPGGEQLGDDVRPVAVHDQRRQPVAFGVDHAVRRGGEARPPGLPPRDPPRPPPRRDRLSPPPVGT